MSIEIEKEDEALIREKVASGLYGGVSEALHEAIALLDERDRALAWLQNEIAPAQAEIDRGEGIAMSRDRFMQIVERGISEASVKKKPVIDARAS